MYQQSYIITVEREEAYKTRRERAQKRMLRAQRTGAIQGGTLAVLVMVLLMLVFARSCTSAEQQELPTASTAIPMPSAAIITLEYEEEVPMPMQPVETPAQETEELQYIGEYTVTHYCPCIKCCGKAEDDPWYGITATGTVATEGRTIAVDPSVIPYGSRVAVFYEDGRICYYIAEDCGGAINGNKIDVFINDHDRAWELGVKSASVYIVNGE